MAQYIVTLKQRDQLDGFYADMKSGGYTCVNKRPISRATHYDLTESQADTIAGDSRVLAVELHPDENPNIVFGPDGYVNNEVPAAAAGDFYKGLTTDSGDYQWGHLHCAGDDAQRRKGSWGSGSVVDTVEWFNNGKHVDVVICDDNAAYDCQDWHSTLDPASTRYVQYDWYANHNSQVLGGIDDDGYTSGPSNYQEYFPNAGHTDYHGTHVTGTVAGKHYGWATEANIYNIQCLGGMGSPMPVLLLFDYLRAFHRNKPINPETGHKNPTITNHSWSSRYDYRENFPSGYSISDITNVHWRGTTYTSANPGPSGWTMAGIERDFGVGQWHRQIPIYYTSVAADVEDAIEDGVVVIAAAGNTDFYVASDSSHPDWGNFFTIASIGSHYYNRGSSPGNAPGAICVGSLDKASDFSKSSFSNFGEAVDVWAPGTDINSVFNNQGYSDVKYGGDNYFYSISGTSMASPQVCGVAACLATGKERFTNSDVKGFLQNYCKDSDMTFDDTYTSARHQIYPVQLTATANGWDVTGDNRYGDHINVINPTIEIFEGDSIDFQLMTGGVPLYITTSPVTGLSGGATPQGQVSWFPHQGANTTGTFQASAPWPGSAGDYYYVCGDMTLSFTTWPQGILRVHPPLHYDDPHIGAGSVNKYLLSANPRPVADGFPSRWYQQQLKGRRRDEEATSNNPPNMQLYPRENLYHRGFNIHQNYTPPQGQQAYTTSGTYSWTCPSDVTSVSVVCVGGGGGGGNCRSTTTPGGLGFGFYSGGGGALAYKNNITVVPGQSYTVVVGEGGTGQTNNLGGHGTAGTESYFIDTSTVVAYGGASETSSTPATYVGDGGGNGGEGAGGGGSSSTGGGGGAGGYSGAGGNGGEGLGVDPTSGSGGGGAGGTGPNADGGGGAGGGVGILGEGSSGTAIPASGNGMNGGPGGSGGADGGDGEASFGGIRGKGGTGGNYGGGGGRGNAGYQPNQGRGGDGGEGAVRIIWGNNRSFPSTNTADV